MIQIINISPDPTPFGNHQYEVRINGKLIVRFDHKREDGLAACLRKASDAVEKNKWQAALEALKVMDDQKHDLF